MAALILMPSGMYFSTLDTDSIMRENSSMCHRKSSIVAMHGTNRASSLATNPANFRVEY